LGKKRTTVVARGATFVKTFKGGDGGGEEGVLAVQLTGGSYNLQTSQGVGNSQLTGVGKTVGQAVKKIRLYKKRKKKNKGNGGGPEYRWGGAVRPTKKGKDKRRGRERLFLTYRRGKKL